MEENRNTFMCGICRAGFPSCSFLQFLEHAVRHLSVARNNSCLICHKRFARTLSLKEHLLHYHAIPLKNSPETLPGMENICNTVIHGSARCTYLHKSELQGRHIYKNNLTSMSQMDSALGNNSLPDCSKANVWEGTDNSNSSIDVLTMKAEERETNTTVCDVEWSSEHNIQLNNNIDEACGSSIAGSLSTKVINPNLLLIDDPSVNEMSFEETLDKNVFPGNVKVCSEMVNQPCSNEPQVDATVSYEDNQLTSSNVNVHLGGVGNVQGDLESCAFGTTDIGNSFSENGTSKAQAVQFIPSSQNSNGLHNFELKTNQSSGCHKVGHFSEEIANVNSEPQTVTSNVSHSGGNDSKNSVPNYPNGDRYLNITFPTIDFHFLLGTTVIKGNSLTYDRLEFRCLHCPFVSSWRPSLVRHMRCSHSDVLDFHEILDIKPIEAKSSQNVQLNKYKVTKMSDYVLASRLVRERKNRSRRIERQDKLGKYNCPVCNKVFRRMRYVRRHQLSHNTKRNHLCETCGKAFKTKAAVVAHRRSHDSRSYHCPQCDFSSNLSGAIHRHRQIHPNGSIMCDICGAAYTDKSTLKKHKRVHDANRPFSCTFPGCTWRFKSEHMKNAHMRTHISEGKFRCPHCGYHFRHKHHLQRHLSKVHPQHQPKVNSDSVYSSSPEFKSGIGGAPSISQSRNQCEDDFMRNSTNFTLTSAGSSFIPQEQIFSSANENVSLPPNEFPSSACMEIEVSQTPVRIHSEYKPAESLISAQNYPQEPSAVEGSKPIDSSSSIRLEENTSFMAISPGNLGNLEFTTENVQVEVGPLIKPSPPTQVIMRQDGRGNLVEYRITGVQRQEQSHIQSPQVYIIESDGNVLAADIEDQNLSLA